MRKTIAALIILSVSIIGCATFPKSEEPVQKSNLTVATIKEGLVKGQTTQAEVLKLFGAPNLVTKNRDNNEVWNYNKMSVKAMSGDDFTWLGILGGSRAMSTTTTQSFDLIIEFDKNEIVKDYSVVSANY